MEPSKLVFEAAADEPSINEMPCGELALERVARWWFFLASDVISC